MKAIEHSWREHRGDIAVCTCASIKNKSSFSGNASIAAHAFRGNAIIGVIGKMWQMVAMQLIEFNALTISLLSIKYISPTINSVGFAVC